MISRCNRLLARRTLPLTRSNCSCFQQNLRRVMTNVYPSENWNQYQRIHRASNVRMTSGKEGSLKTAASERERKRVRTKMCWTMKLQFEFVNYLLDGSKDLFVTWIRKITQSRIVSSVNPAVPQLRRFAAVFKKKNLTFLSSWKIHDLAFEYRCVQLTKWTCCYINIHQHSMGESSSRMNHTVLDWPKPRCSDYCIKAAKSDRDHHFVKLNI